MKPRSHWSRLKYSTLHLRGQRAVYREDDELWSQLAKGFHSAVENLCTGVDFFLSR